MSSWPQLRVVQCPHTSCSQDSLRAQILQNQAIIAERHLASLGPWPREVKSRPLWANLNAASEDAEEGSCQHLLLESPDKTKVDNNAEGEGAESLAG